MTTNKNKVRRPMSIYFILLCFLFLFLFFSFNIEISPKRTLRVVNVNGEVVQGARVSQEYDQYSLLKHNVFDVYSNFNGEVSLPQRKIKTNIFSLLFGALKQIKELGIHASYGTYESIWVFKKGYPEKWFYDGKGLESGVVILGDTSPDAE